ncbi:ATP-binding protein [Corynebacterium glucuronolyticum]|uniref:ATP-binding protein n=1 Tax=Corynebacterium glucuronolyticum TaxID=39791 RepID=UPI00223B6A96|nr:DUF4143 domain-containing protein [Corynebacterium glucuronolyticum]MCT1442957.1 DUF4143 domain-containing protein [Corynebacterium glucuronolyticum]
MAYIRRAVDSILSQDLQAVGGVLIEGARGCGKTETGLQHAQSFFRVDHAQNQRLAALNPQAALQGDTPRLIDEWQLEPSLWNEVRHEIDARRKPGQFILSGSAFPADSITRHTGAGRLTRIKMRPMALGEAYYQDGCITLNQLREITSVPALPRTLAYKELSVEAVRGGWPALIAHDNTGFIRFNRALVENIAHVDLPDIGKEFAPERVRRLLRSVARNVASETTATTLSKDISADGGQLTPLSVRRYLDALTRIFILEELPPWSGKLRSKSRLRKQSKLHFCDPSIACAALGTTPEGLANDPEYFGQVFESMAVRDIRTYADQIGASCFGYRDDVGLEVDIICEFDDGHWAGIEIKLGESDSVISSAESNLLRLKDSRMVTEPDFLAVVTGGYSGFTLPSGVHVVPLSTLGPERS